MATLEIKFDDGEMLEELTGLTEFINDIVDDAIYSMMKRLSAKLTSNQEIAILYEGVKVDEL